MPFSALLSSAQGGRVAYVVLHLNGYVGMPAVLRSMPVHPIRPPWRHWPDDNTESAGIGGGGGGGGGGSAHIWGN